MPASAAASAACLVLGLALGAPFEDTQKRFVVDLPGGWSFAPQPGDVTGAAFQREHQGALANFVVRVERIGSKTTLDDFIGRLSGTLAAQPGFTLLEEEHGRLAGLSTVRRRYTVAIPDSDLAKMGEDWFGVHGGKGYVVRLESLASTFGRFEADFRHLLASLRFAGVDAAAPHPHPPELVGRWAMEGAEGTIFTLKADGTFDLDGTPGVWRVAGADLMTRPLGGGAETFRWRLQGDLLELSHESFGGSIRYRRLSGAGAPAASAPAQPTLEGTWRAKGHHLVLGPGDAVRLNGQVGTYTRAGDLLILNLPGKGKKARRMVVSFDLAGDRLTLREDRFGGGVVFDRR